MSHQYVPVQWNRKKVVYDLVLWVGILLYVGIFMGVTAALFPGDAALSPMIVLMRAFATLAFLMLTFILCIGPLARLDRRFLPLLYNRRHFGVSMFIVALVHAILATLWYHGFGVISPIASIMGSPGDLTSISNLPFQPFGVAALLILLLMAATSHDFWNTNLGPVFWKTLHMGVYLAYALLVVHIAAGAMQTDNTGLLPAMVFASVVLVSGLHVSAAVKGMSQDTGLASVEWVDVGAWQDIENNHGMVATIAGGECIAIFRYDETRIAAVGNVCKHQAGPLGEGRVIDGCITCPWHGFQYRPEDGCSPAPFNEKIPTYRARVEGDRILVHPTPLPDGTPREVAIIGGAA